MKLQSSQIYKQSILTPLRDSDHDVGVHFRLHCCIHCVPQRPSGLSTPLHLTQWGQFLAGVHSASQMSGLQRSTLGNCRQHSRPGRHRGVVSWSSYETAGCDHGPSVGACLFRVRQPRQTSPRSGTAPDRGRDPLAVGIPIEAARSSATPADRHDDCPFGPHPVPHRWDYEGPVRWHCPSRFCPSVASFSVKSSSFNNTQLSENTMLSIGAVAA